MDALGTTDVEGEVVVAGVFPGSPADRAGLKYDDTLVAIWLDDGAEIAADAADTQGLLTFIYLEVGRSVDLDVERGGAPLTLNIKNAPQVQVVVE